MPDKKEVVGQGRGEPALDQDYLLAHFLPFTSHVQVQWFGSNGVEVSLCSSSNEFSEELVRVVKQEFGGRPLFELESIFDLSSCNIVISMGFSSRSLVDSVSEIGPSLKKAVDDFRDGRFKAEIQKAHTHGRWSIPSKKFDLTFVSCHIQSIDLEQRYKEVQQSLEEINAQREKWLLTQAEPLLDAMEELLHSKSLPSEYRDELSELHATLRADAYRYSSLMDANAAKQIFDLSYRRFQTLVQEGRLGHSISRFYVHCEEEVRRVAAKERHRGRSLTWK